MLEVSIAMMERSKFVAEAIREKIDREKKVASAMSMLDAFRTKVNVRPGLSSLELLRKSRYEIK